MNAQVSKSILIGFGFSLFCGLAEAETPPVHAAPDRVLADFEGPDYGGWVATGDAFGRAPASGTFSRQQRVTGFAGRGLVNTFLNVDQSTGSLTSPPFTLDRNFLKVLIGGGNHPGQTGLELLVDGQVVAALTGRNLEALTLQSIALAKWKGRQAQVRIIDHSTGSWGHINVDHLVLSDSLGASTPAPVAAAATAAVNGASRIPFLSNLQRQTLEAAYDGMTLEEQRVALETDPEVLRYRAMRQAKAEDPYRPFYHFSTPEGLLNDPNGFCYWQGNYHLFYQLQAVGTGVMQWGHAVSPDLVHWQDLPIALRWEGSGAIFSGQVLVEPDRVIAMYHNTAQGNCIALADDPLLLNFEKLAANPVVSGNTTPAGFIKPFDPCIWKQDDGFYYSVSGNCKGGSRTGNGFPQADLFRSPDLVQWEYIGLLIEDEDWMRMGLGKGDDAAVPNLQPLQTRDDQGRLLGASSRYMFNWFSHGAGGRALVGSYDPKQARFHPERFYSMNYGPVYQGTLHAPSAMLDEAGRLIVVYNVRENMQDTRQALSTRSATVWYGIMTLPRHYWVNPQGELRMAPIGDLASLRQNHQSRPQQTLPAGAETVLAGIRGRAMELQLTLEPGSASKVGLKVLRSPDGSEFTAIRYDAAAGTLELDVSQGSQRGGVPARRSEVGPLVLEPGEPLRLRVFVDRSIVEVFANDRQCLTARVYPAGEQSATVSLVAEGGAATLRSLDAWQMKSAWPELNTAK